MTRSSDVEKIKQALLSGRLTIPDPATGYHRSLYARCPLDGKESPVGRIERSASAITRVVFDCPLCDKQFGDAPAEMILR